MAVNVFARSDQPYMSRQGFRMLGNHRFLEMAQDRYVAFDLETTGFHPRSCRILELGAVRVVRGRVEAEFDMLVDPECAIPDRITELTGINQMMVMGQPLIGEALEAFLDFAGRDPLIAHNADFDLSFLKHWTGVSGLAMPDTYADSLEIARDENDLTVIRQELTNYGYLKGHGRGKKNKKIAGKSQPFHYISSDGFHMYVGRNNFQNDELTFRFANGKDMWFHAKQMAGSHVIVKLGTADQLPDRTYEEAARLAAHYSKGKNAPKVDADYTERRNLRKPPHARPGFVIYHTNYSMTIEPDITGITELP